MVLGFFRSNFHDNYYNSFEIQNIIGGQFFLIALHVQHCAGNICFFVAKISYLALIYKESGFPFWRGDPKILVDD